MNLFRLINEAVLRLAAYRRLLTSIACFIYASCSMQVKHGVDGDGNGIKKEETNGPNTMPNRDKNTSSVINAIEQCINGTRGNITWKSLKKKIKMLLYDNTTKDYPGITHNGNNILHCLVNLHTKFYEESSRYKEEKSFFTRIIKSPKAKIKLLERAVEILRHEYLTDNPRLRLVNALNRDNETPLERAIKCINPIMFDVLLQSPPTIQDKDSYHLFQLALETYSIQHGAKTNDTLEKIISKLLDKLITSSYKTINGNNALHTIVILHSNNDFSEPEKSFLEEVARKLLSWFPELANTLNKDSNTPLSKTIRLIDLQMFSILCPLTDLTNIDNLIPLKLAIEMYCEPSLNPTNKDKLEAMIQILVNWIGKNNITNDNNALEPIKKLYTKSDERLSEDIKNKKLSLEKVIPTIKR